MSKILKSPGKYVQGRGVLKELDQYLQGLGNRLLILISQSGIKRICPTLDECFSGKDYTLRYEIFQGECSQTQIEGFCVAGKEMDCTVVIGIGGGKILDTAKAVAYKMSLPVVIIPTVASTDSPCSSLSVIYKDGGEFDHYLYLDACPNVVLVDTDVILKAPVALLVAGMGDALATYFEARACRNSGHDNQTAGKPTIAASGLAAMCWKYLQRDGLRAKLAIEVGACTEAVETVVEVNTYLSSVGFESGGLAAAHAIQKGFTFIPELHDLYHGNKVAFCTIAQLILEDADPDELENVLRFCCNVGLPVCFADMGYFNIDHTMLRKAAEKACVPGSTIHHMPFQVTPEMVYHALLAADAAGQNFMAKQNS
jgi:Glycerol dehydrogenase and related enzymes